MIIDESDKPLLDLYRSVAKESPAAATTHAILREAARHGAVARRRSHRRVVALCAAAAMLLILIQQLHSPKKTSFDGGRETLLSTSTRYLVRLQPLASNDSDIGNYLLTQDLTLVPQDVPENGD